MNANAVKKIAEERPLQFISTAALSAQGFEALFALAQDGKRSFWRKYRDALKGRVIGLLFFNPSLRTRASFLSGLNRLGANAVVINPGSESWGIEYVPGAVMNGTTSEHISEACMVLSSYFDAVCVRAFPALESWEQDKADTVINAFGKHLDVPLINMESSLWHPCQALADALTLKEQFKGNQKKKKFVLSWAPHPKQLPMAVPNSTLLMAAQMGMDVTLACPKGYELDSEVIALSDEAAKLSGGSVAVCNDQNEAFDGADVIYAKSWTPPRFIGKQADEMAERQNLQHWTVGVEQMAKTKDAYFMHCLPVRRNVVVTDAVLDSPRSLIAEQVANRLHMQNALLISMFGVEGDL